jgi:hypothetical protein
MEILRVIYIQELARSCIRIYDTPHLKKKSNNWAPGVAVDPLDCTAPGSREVYSVRIISRKMS